MDALALLLCLMTAVTGGAADPTDGAMGTRGRTMCRINLGRMQVPVTATAGVW
jgi:hypothetical protein